MVINANLNDLLWRIVVYSRMGWVAANNGKAEEANDYAWLANLLREEAEQEAPPDVVARGIAARFRATHPHALRG